ncbi:hypothetical protein PM082_015454 [Marasmius tenuissimus]|nr:hypothetical protein PM082_015454 [Marasmius tenuissimus]
MPTPTPTEAWSARTRPANGRKKSPHLVPTGAKRWLLDRREKENGTIAMVEFKRRLQGLPQQTALFVVPEACTRYLEAETPIMFD